MGKLFWSIRTTRRSGTTHASIGSSIPFINIEKCVDLLAQDAKAVDFASMDIVPTVESVAPGRQRGFVAILRNSNGSVRYFARLRQLNFSSNSRPLFLRIFSFTR